MALAAAAADDGPVAARACAGSPAAGAVVEAGGAVVLVVVVDVDVVVLELVVAGAVARRGPAVEHPDAPASRATTAAAAVRSGGIGVQCDSHPPAWAENGVMTAGMLLTGGASRRLGTDKASVTIRGITLAAAAGRLLSSVAAPAIEVGDGVSGLASVREAPPGDGPLAAVAAGFRALHASGYDGAALVLATDLPDITVALLELIAGWPGAGAVVPIADGHRQSLCARYPAHAGSLATELLARGERSMQALLRELDVVEVSPEQWNTAAPPSAFFDVDTPADLDRLHNKRE
jgi:molybdopterin-guanine dinucleotide biosynthesis protein A